MTDKSKTKKELKKEVRLLIVKEAENLENLIKVNPSISNLSELLFSVAKIKQLAKSHSEVLRLAEVVCFCGKTESNDKYFKHLLYSETNKILENSTQSN